MSDPQLAIVMKLLTEQMKVQNEVMKKVLSAVNELTNIVKELKASS